MPNENENVREKYLNWLSLIETDYITMFIKTWFTFLASLQELIKDNNINRRSGGDKPILEKYKMRIFDNNFPIQINEEFKKNVLHAYLQAKNKALNSDDFMAHYFDVFYKIEASFSDSNSFVYTYRGKKTSLPLKVFKEGSGKEKNIYLKIKLRDERRKFIDYFEDNNIETRISLSEEIQNSKIFENKVDFIDKILTAVRDEAKRIVENNNRLDERGKERRLDFLNNECLRDIKRILSERLDMKSIFPLKPDNAIANLNSNTLEIQNEPQDFEENLTKWFIDFSYKLRNILFHFIIDPMDKNWQLLFKHAYLALKHLTEENIKLLKNRGAENDNCDT